MLELDQWRTAYWVVRAPQQRPRPQSHAVRRRKRRHSSVGGRRLDVGDFLVEEAVEVACADVIATLKMASTKQLVNGLPHLPGFGPLNGKEREGSGEDRRGREGSGGKGGEEM